MRNLGIDELVEGMEVASDVVGSAGELILPRGTKLTVRSIESLRRRGCTKVPIAGDAVDLNTLFTDQELADVRTGIESKLLRLSREAPLGQRIIEETLRWQLDKEAARRIEKLDNQASAQPPAAAPKA